MTNRYRLGIDVGGTFTVFSHFDERGSEIAELKRLTTPTSSSIAVIEGTAALLQGNDVRMAEVESIAQGTMLVTNAVIDLRGARTGMLVTTGFRDILAMGFEQRYERMWCSATASPSSFSAARCVLTPTRHAPPSRSTSRGRRDSIRSAPPRACTCSRTSTWLGRCASTLRSAGSTTGSRRWSRVGTLMR